VQAAATVEALAAGGSLEEAARTRRLFKHARPDLLRPKGAAAELPVLAAALRAKACAHSARPVSWDDTCNASSTDGQWSAAACLVLLKNACLYFRKGMHG
jgi:hypothetical protein